MGRCAILIVALSCAFAQDIVSVKRTPAERRNQLKFDKCVNGGAFVEEGAPLLWVVEFAYHIDDNEVAGYPAWIESFDEAYDITAKPDRRLSPDDCRAMAQRFLADRFQLQVHKETRERPVYFLVVAPGGHKLTRVEANSPNEPGVRFNGRHPAILAEPTPPPGWNIQRLAYFLEGQLDDRRRVLDKTNLPGLYSFNLDYSRDGVDRPFIAQALHQQLGLKLDPGKAPVEVLVIDRIERPTDN